MPPESCDYDVLIVGGGMVGASLACALGDSPLRVAVIEATPLELESQPSFDARTVALALGSRRIFETLGLWPAIEAEGVTAIRHIHVSDQGHMGASHLDSAEEDVEALGYVAPSRHLGRVLHAALAEYDNIDVLCPARVSRVELKPHRAVLEIETGTAATTRPLTGRLLVAADGGESRVRRQLGIATFEVDYGQHAVIANVRMERPHQGVAWERFTRSGPMALLPARGPEGREDVYALVWTVDSAQLDSVLHLDDAQFLARLQQRFSGRVEGFVDVGTRQAYPLRWMQSREHVRPRLAIIGNAAHSLHPVAGQGFNLGLRDVAVLAEVLIDNRRAGRDPGDLAVLRRYAGWRRRDHLQTALFTDGLVRLFSNNLPPLALARNLGLLLVDMLPAARHTLARHAMGIGGRLPRLARGLRL